MITLSDVQRRVGVDPDGKWGPATLAAIAKALGIEAPSRKLRDPKLFFENIRDVTGSLDQTQVNVINHLLTNTAHWPVSWVAYALATAWHECRFRPINERGGPIYLRDMYDIAGNRPALARKMGNIHPGDGIRYAGRGLVQLTWRSNYRRAGAALGIDLEGKPDLALDLNNATRILVWGMQGGEFTGVSLRDCLPNDTATFSQFTNARRIINGRDKAAQIADYAVDFQSALWEGGWGS